MHTNTIKIIDPSRKVVATAEVADEGTHYGGTIDLRESPPEQRALFEEFEEVVNGQMFAFLDDVQQRLESLRLRAVFEGGQEARLTDLQVFPSTGEVSFKLEGTPVVPLSFPRDFPRRA